MKLRNPDVFFNHSTLSQVEKSFFIFDTFLIRLNLFPLPFPRDCNASSNLEKKGEKKREREQSCIV